MRTFHFRALLAVTLLTTTPFANGQVLGSLAAGTTTAEALNLLEQEATNLMDGATNRGDYLLARAGQEARMAVDNLRLALDGELSTAFTKLDAESRATFGRLDASIAQMTQGALNAVQGIQQVADTGQQITTLLDVQGHRSYVIRSKPTVWYPGRPDPFVLHVTGVNLDEAKAQLEVGGATIAPNVLGKQEISFQLPPSAFTAGAGTTSAHFELRYMSVKPGWWARMVGSTEQQSRDVVVTLLPKAMGTYNSSTKITSTVRNTDPHDDPQQQFKAHNDDRTYTVTPPPGWYLDVNSLWFQETGGESGHCIGFDANKSADGATFHAHLGEINQGARLHQNGWVNCHLKWTFYQDVETTIPGPSKSGSVDWTSYAAVPLPDKVQSSTLDVTSFDGRTRTYSVDGLDQNGLYKVTFEPTRIVVTPQIPADFN